MRKLGDTTPRELLDRIRRAISSAVDAVEAEFRDGDPRKAERETFDPVADKVLCPDTNLVHRSDLESCGRTNHRMLYTRRTES